MNAFGVCGAGRRLALWLGIGCLGVAGAVAEPEAARQALIEALAESRFEADGLRARLEALTFGVGGAWNPDAGGVGWLDGATLETLKVLDINRELRMLVLSGGRRVGLRPGMRFALMRGERVSARVRIIDVRREVSGAVIEWEDSRRPAGVSDRTVLLRESR